MFPVPGHLPFSPLYILNTGSMFCTPKGIPELPNLHKFTMLEAKQRKGEKYSHVFPTKYDDDTP